MTKEDAEEISHIIGIEIALNNAVAARDALHTLNSSLLRIAFDDSNEEQCDAADMIEAVECVISSLSRKSKNVVKRMKIVEEWNKKVDEINKKYGVDND